MLSSRRANLQQKLSWMPKVWLAAQEGLRLLTHTCIDDFTLEDAKELDLPAYFQDLEDVEYFSVSHTRVRNRVSQPGLNAALVKADLLSRSCTRSVYTFWGIMHCILGADPELKCIRWMRRNPYPDIVVFVEGDVVVPLNHDYFLISYLDGKSFVVDLTAAQFGWEGWLFTKKEYEEKLVTWRLEPERVDALAEIKELDANEGRVKVMKEVVERCFVEVRETLREDVEVPADIEEKVRLGVLEALSFEDGDEEEDEGYATEKNERLT